MLRKIANVPRSEALAALAAVVISAVLMAIKFIAYYWTGSAAIFSDALESIVNVAASSFAAYSLFLAHQPADVQHPYGHGKVEFLSAGFEGGMILLAALVILAQALLETVQPGGPRIGHVEIGLTLTVIAGGTNALLGLLLVRVGTRQRSVALQADGRHLLSDAVTSLAVLVGLILVKTTGWRYADPIAAAVVALYISRMAWGMLRTSAAGLMDEQDLEDQQLLIDILDAHVGPEGKEPRICSYHKLRHRHSGRYHWVDFHVVVPADWDVRHGHEVASAIEHEIEQALGEGNATAHVEPCAGGACGACVAQAG
ncbi:MAG TPA: cation diffusion facilitator family transporter [Tepidisphaeraceae bacterium]|jgi:cation diffusion facilitator family transporter